MNTILYRTDTSILSGYRTASFDEIIAGAKPALSRRFRRGTLLDSPTATRNFLTVTLGDREFESFRCIFVDNRHRVIDFVELFRGTIDGAHPREVVKLILTKQAAACLLIHTTPAKSANSATPTSSSPRG